MIKRKGDIDGFWMFIIGVAVVLPAIRAICGTDGEKSGDRDNRPKVVNVKGSVLEVSNNNTVAPVQTVVKIPIIDGTLIVKKVSPDRGEPQVVEIKGKYAIMSFDSVGSWEINMYDADSILLDWVKVTVY